MYCLPILNLVLKNLLTALKENFKIYTKNNESVHNRFVAPPIPETREKAFPRHRHNPTNSERHRRNSRAANAARNGTFFESRSFAARGRNVYANA